MAANLMRYLVLTGGVIGVGWAVMKVTVPSKEEMLRVRSAHYLLTLLLEAVKPIKRVYACYTPSTYAAALLLLCSAFLLKD